MEALLTLHTVLDNGQVQEIVDGLCIIEHDCMEEVRLPKKRRYCGEDQSRHSWDVRGLVSTEPPTPVLVEPMEFVEENIRGHDGIPVYSASGQRSARVYHNARVLQLPVGAIAVKHEKPAKVVSDASPGSNAARVRWSEEDDKLLIVLVSQLGHNWPLIANKMDGRTSKQVKERWTNQLDPSISTEPWTAEDDQHLVELIREIGHSWCEIARRMKGRTESMVKNRYHANLRKRFGNHIFDPTIPLPTLSFKPKSLKSKKTVISDELRAAAAEAAEKAATIHKTEKRRPSSDLLLPAASYYGSEEETIY